MRWKECYGLCDPDMLQGGLARIFTKLLLTCARCLTWRCQLPVGLRMGSWWSRPQMHSPRQGTDPNPASLQC